MGNLDNGCRSIMSDQNKEKQQEEDDIVGYVQMMMYVSNVLSGDMERRSVVNAEPASYTGEPEYIKTCLQIIDMYLNTMCT